MGKKVLMLGCLLLAFLSMHAQSAWRIFPDRMIILNIYPFYFQLVII